MTIVYCSNTGSAKKYAELLSEKTGIPCTDISKSSAISPDEEIIFIGWIMASALQGLKEIRSTFSNIRAICGVGMMKGEKITEETKAKNGITEPYFFLPGDFNMNKLTGMHKMMMGMMLKMMKGKIKESGDEKGAEMLKMLEDGIILFDEKEIDPIVEILK